MPLAGSFAVGSQRFPGSEETPWTLSAVEHREVWDKREEVLRRGWNVHLYAAEIKNMRLFRGAGESAAYDTTIPRVNHSLM
jgi:hypothetical protein